MEIPNYWWYLLLFICSAIFFTVSFWKNNNRKRLLQTFFFIAGLSYLFDFIVLVLFNGYQYKPNLVKPLWFDSSFGSIFSQGIAVPVAAMTIVSFNLGFIWILILSIFFIGIEELFLTLKIYEQHWWKTYYTGIFLVGGFYLSKKWFELLRFPSTMTKFVTMYMTLCVYSNSLRFAMVLLFSTHFYSVGWFPDSIRDHIAANALFLFILMFPITTVIVYRYNWRWIFTFLALEWIVTQTFVRFNILNVAPFWKVSYFVLISLGSIFIFRFVYVKWFVNEV